MRNKITAFLICLLSANVIAGGTGDDLTPGGFRQIDDEEEEDLDPALLDSFC